MPLKLLSFYRDIGKSAQDKNVNEINNVADVADVALFTGAWGWRDC
jgi:hypothetical protein